MKKPGERFLNEKNELCQVITSAIDDVTGEERLVYQKLSGNYEVRIKSSSPAKQPETVVTAEQPQSSAKETTTEQPQSSVKETIAEQSQPSVKEVIAEQPQSSVKSVENKAMSEGEVTEIFEGDVDPDLLAFLEADTVDEKLEVLYNIKDTTDEKLLTAIEASLDIAYSEGSPDERVAFIRRNLMTKAKYEGSRLR